jgi:phenylacetyl-CoA:acceptor oxidoreductase subunit 2
MSRETLTGIIFIPVAALDWLFPHPALWALAAVSAMGLMISQGFIFHRIRAVPAWNAPLVPLLFLSSGFATGSGLLMLVAPGELTVGTRPVLVGLGCIAINVAVWLLYLRWPDGVAFHKAMEVLRRPNRQAFTVGVGHLAPILLLSLSLLTPGAGAGVGLGRVATTLAGLSIIAGGVSLKSGLVLKAGYMRGIVLGRPKDEAPSASPALPASRSPEETY